MNSDDELGNVGAVSRRDALGLGLRLLAGAVLTSYVPVATAADKPKIDIRKVSSEFHSLLSTAKELHESASDLVEGANKNKGELVGLESKLQELNQWRIEQISKIQREFEGKQEHRLFARDVVKFRDPPVFAHRELPQYGWRQRPVTTYDKIKGKPGEQELRKLKINFTAKDDISLALEIFETKVGTNPAKYFFLVTKSTYQIYQVLDAGTDSQEVRFIEDQNYDGIHFGNGTADTFFFEYLIDGRFGRTKEVTTFVKRGDQRKRYSPGKQKTFDELTTSENVNSLLYAWIQNIKPEILADVSSTRADVSRLETLVESQIAEIESKKQEVSQTKTKYEREIGAFKTKLYAGELFGPSFDESVKTITDLISKSELSVAEFQELTSSVHNIDQYRAIVRSKKIEYTAKGTRKYDQDVAIVNGNPLRTYNTGSGVCDELSVLFAAFLAGEARYDIYFTVMKDDHSAHQVSIYQDKESRSGGWGFQSNLYISEARFRTKAQAVRQAILHGNYDPDSRRTRISVERKPVKVGTGKWFYRDSDSRRLTGV